MLIYQLTGDAAVNTLQFRILPELFRLPFFRLELAPQLLILVRLNLLRVQPDTINFLLFLLTFLLPPTLRITSQLLYRVVDLFVLLISHLLHELLIGDFCLAQLHPLFVPRLLSMG